MTAQQMFKKLGYMKEENNFYIRYRNEGKEIIFVFFKVEKRAIIPSREIYRDEIKPFVQQCKELGWLDD